MFFSAPKNLIVTIATIVIFYYLAPSLILILHSKKLGKTISEMTGRERLPIIISGAIFYLIAYFIFLTFRELSMAKITLFLLVFTTVFGLFSIFSKPSFHVCAFAGGIVFLALLFDLRIIILSILTPLIGWSRVVLRAHTRNQVILGAILGVSLSIIFSRI